MKTRKNHIICVKKPPVLLIFPCILLACILSPEIYIAVILKDIKYAILLLIPILIALMLPIDYITWSVCIDKNSIKVKTVFHSKCYNYSQLDQVVLRDLISYRHYSLDLIFADGKRVTVVENYRNYNKFKAQLSKRKSFVIK